MLFIQWLNCYSLLVAQGSLPSQVCVSHSVYSHTCAHVSVPQIVFLWCPFFLTLTLHLATILFCLLHCFGVNSDKMCILQCSHCTLNLHKSHARHAAFFILPSSSATSVGIECITSCCVVPQWRPHISSLHFWLLGPEIAANFDLLPVPTFYAEKPQTFVRIRLFMEPAVNSKYV